MRIELEGMDKQQAEKLCDAMCLTRKDIRSGGWGWNGASLYRADGTSAGFITAGGRVATPLSITLLDVKPYELRDLARAIELEPVGD